MGKVKCAVCGKMFDWSKEQSVKPSERRYAHYACAPDLPLGPKPENALDPEKEKLMDYIKTLFGENTKWAMVQKQIKTFKEENGYSYSGMLKSLVYFYEIKKGDKTKANGSIGIIPFVYQDAYNYYLGLYMAQQQNENKTFITKIKEFIIKTPQKKGTKKKLLDWGNEDEI